MSKEEMQTEKCSLCNGTGSQEYPRKYPGYAGKPNKCSECNGSGAVSINHKYRYTVCPDCLGDGKVYGYINNIVSYDAYPPMGYGCCKKCDGRGIIDHGEREGDHSWKSFFTCFLVLAFCIMGPLFLCGMCSMVLHCCCPQNNLGGI
jgi:hypothetical protein